LPAINPAPFLKTLWLAHWTPNTVQLVVVVVVVVVVVSAWPHLAINNYNNTPGNKKKEHH